LREENITWKPSLANRVPSEPPSRPAPMVAILGLAACARVERRGRGDADRCGDEEMATIPWNLHAFRPHGATLGRATLIEGECGIWWSARTS
jgi:hypothetical protein